MDCVYDDAVKTFKIARYVRRRYGKTFTDVSDLVRFIIRYGIDVSGFTLPYGCAAPADWLREVSMDELNIAFGTEHGSPADAQAII